ncbi:MAG: hypothetical protein KAT70_08815 [Thermoplasmata archaeon]|nr:hypothetical protein [Thermoplasmata archaeon]
MSEDLVNWTHVLNKTYRDPSIVEMEDGRLMVAYVSNVSGSDDIWVDIVDLRDEPPVTDQGEDLGAIMAKPVVWMPLAGGVTFVALAVGLHLRRGVDRHGESGDGEESEGQEGATDTPRDPADAGEEEEKTGQGLG